MLARSAPGDKPGDEPGDLGLVEAALHHRHAVDLEHGNPQAVAVAGRRVGIDIDKHDARPEHLQEILGRLAEVTAAA